MHLVLGYAVWPSPFQLSTTPEPSALASTPVAAYGVAGSCTVPITRIGGAPGAEAGGSG